MDCIERGGGGMLENFGPSYAFHVVYMAGFIIPYMLTERLI